MRIVFAGTPEFALPALEVIADRELCAVLTAPDRPAGRGGRERPSPVKRAALARGLHVLQPERIGRGFSAELAHLRPDLLVAVAYGKIFRPYFLELFSRGGVNVHPSLLPELRGPAPIPAAILAGAARTGVTVQQLAAAMDAGDILAQTEVPLDGSDTTALLTDRLAGLGAALLRQVIDAIAAGEASPRPQVEADATYCSFLNKEDGRIDWSRPAEAIERAVRAYDPWPRTYTTWQGRRLVIHSAAVAFPTVAGAPGQVAGVDRGRGILVHTGERGLWLRRLQLEGRKPADWLAFANGHPDVAHARLGR